MFWHDHIIFLHESYFHFYFFFFHFLECCFFFLFFFTSFFLTKERNLIPERRKTSKKKKKHREGSFDLKYTRDHLDQFSLWILRFYLIGNQTLGVVWCKYYCPDSCILYSNISFRFSIRDCFRIHSTSNTTNNIRFCKL